MNNARGAGLLLLGVVLALPSVAAARRGAPIGGHAAAVARARAAAAAKARPTRSAPQTQLEHYQVRLRRDGVTARGQRAGLTRIVQPRGHFWQASVLRSRQAKGVKGAFPAQHLRIFFPATLRLGRAWSAEVGKGKSFFRVVAVKRRRGLSSSMTYKIRETRVVGGEASFDKSGALKLGKGASVVFAANHYFRPDVGLVKSVAKDLRTNTVQRQTLRDLGRKLRELRAARNPR